ncbi:hypothetical protein [Jatrophihabitans lederbergiae]
MGRTSRRELMDTARDVATAWPATRSSRAASTG